MESRPAAIRRLAAAMLVLAAVVPAFERHGGTKHLERTGGPALAIEVTALHAAADAHVEAAGERRADGCDLCARLANAGVGLAVPFAAAASAQPTRLALHPLLVSPGTAARLGVPAGRAPPLG